MTARTATWSATIALAVTAALTPSPAAAQYYPQQQQGYPQQGYPQPQQGYPQQGYSAKPQALAPQQLDQLVGPIALYPDPLLAQALTAATFWDQIPEAAGWAQQYGNLQGDQLAQAINQSNLPWDPSVVALLPFPSVLELMMRDQNWTQQLGQAVLVQRGDVMDAVQRMRQTAMQYGYLQNNEYMQVSTPYQGEIQILPAYAGAYYVPRYDPRVVYYRPSRGLSIGAVFNFGPRITIGSAFAPWGWSNPGFAWRRHEVLIDRRPWTRTWNDRTSYVRSQGNRYDGRSNTYYRGGTQGVDSRSYDRNRVYESNRVVEQNRSNDQNRTYDRSRWSDQNRAAQPQSQVQDQRDRSYRMQQQQVQQQQVQRQAQAQQQQQQQNDMRQQRMQQQQQQQQAQRQAQLQQFQQQQAQRQAQQQQNEARQQRQQPQAQPQRSVERNRGGEQNQNRGGGEHFRGRGGENDSNGRRDR